MLRYLSADIICSEKRTVFRERSSRKTVNFDMSYEGKVRQTPRNRSKGHKETDELHAKPTQRDPFVLFEGDIMVERWFLVNLSGINKRGAKLNRLNSRHNYYWPGIDFVNGSRIVRIPYKFKFGWFAEFFGTGPVKAVRKAFEQFHKRTCLRFEEKTDKDKDYIEIVAGTGCWSQIGRQGEIQQLSLGKGCETRGRAIHELMHGIGFYHEQSRQDRDQHVKILLQNVENGKESQFKSYRQETGNLPYDFHSIMHYSNTFFSKDIEGKVPTIQALIDPNMQLGQSDSFSALDVVRINMLYKCPQLRTDLTLYFVTVYTAAGWNAGTDSKVDIMLSGTKGDSGEIVLEATDEIPDPFERGRNDTFPVIVPNIGKFVSLRIRLSGSSWWWSAADWKLNKVEIETPDDRKQLKAPLILTADIGDHW